MKIGFQSSSFDKEGYGRWGEDTYKKMREHGFVCSDFAMCDTESVIYTFDKEIADSLILHEKELANNAGVEVVQLHGPWQYPPKDSTEEERAERMEQMKKSIRFASLLNCKYWVIHPIMPYGTDDVLIGKEEETWKLNMEFMSELLVTAKKYDVTICLENMPMVNFSVATPEKILEFMKEINDEHFKICLDTGHVSVFPDLSVGDEVRRLGKEIKVLHVHDNRGGMDLHLMPYLGIIDWKDFAKSLKEIGFDGCFSLETVFPDGLSDDVFEDFAKLTNKIAKEIVSSI